MSDEVTSEEFDLLCQVVDVILTAPVFIGIEAQVAPLGREVLEKWAALRLPRMRVGR